MFINALIKKKHDINRVFFYQEGVLNATDLYFFPSDETDIISEWSALAVNFGIELHVCISAGLRRGILSQEEADNHNLRTYNLSAHFHQSGLGVLAEELMTADRAVQF